MKTLANKSAADIKKAFKEKPPRIDKKLTAADLFKFLRCTQQDADPDHPLGNATGWNYGNCKTILKRLREEGLSDDQIREHLEFLFMNWIEFKDYMVMHANKKLPWYATIPVITTNVAHSLKFAEIKKDYLEAGEDDNEGVLTAEEAWEKFKDED
ncbi:MAG: hypothetical protein COB49_11005 [Alphaproteobacteria bacterium]|nr:MAG: hypothetical protein COB49_11005 [Alphaproteobacteria bacterium]